MYATSVFFNALFFTTGIIETDFITALFVGLVPDTALPGAIIFWRAPIRRISFYRLPVFSFLFVAIWNSSGTPTS
jgi:hypothetical protein